MEQILCLLASLGIIYLSPRLQGSLKIPTGKILESNPTKVDSEPPYGSNTDITNLQECIKTLDSSAGISINVQKEQNLDLSAGTPFNLKKRKKSRPCINRHVISERPRDYMDRLRYKRDTLLYHHPMDIEVYLLS
ncbi:hypothetical protein Tco_0032415 [Tanacetum coccineum]